MRLDKLLSHLGLGSRKDVKQLLKSRRVLVNGSVVKDGKVQVDEIHDEITVDEEVIIYQAEYYFLLHKPQGVITATEDRHARTVIDCLDEQDKKRGLFPVGRLDKDTTGLLLLTTDGPLAHELLAPKKHVAKIYEATIDGEVTSDIIQQFKEGLQLDKGEMAAPSELVCHSISNGKSEISLRIYEGKFHQVKRMFQAVGMRVLRLHRSQMGPLILEDDLQCGHYRPLYKEEVERLLTLKGE